MVVCSGRRDVGRFEGGVPGGGGFERRLRRVLKIAVCERFVRFCIIADSALHAVQHVVLSSVTVTAWFAVLVMGLQRL
jgi:hypothetical protein